jgi:putative inorganic carbon (HCO3(-)) transporter
MARQLGAERSRRSMLAPLLWLGLLAPFFLIPGPWVLAGLIGLAIGWQHFGRPAWRTLESSIRYLLVGVLSAAVIGFICSADPGLSLPKLANILYGMTLGVIAARTARDQWGKDLLRTGLLLASVGVAAVGLVGTEWNSSKFGWFAAVHARLPRLSGAVVDSFGNIQPGIHPNEVGGVLALLLPIACAQAIFPGPSFGRWLGGGVVALSLPTLLLTQSRSAWLGVAGAVILLLARGWRRVWPLVCASLAVGLGGIMAVGPQRFLEILWAVDAVAWRAPMIEARLEIWRRGLLLLRDFPLTGIGLNLFPRLSDQFYPSPTLGPEAHIPHAHNIILQTALDLGLPGALIFFMLIGLTLVRLWRQRDSASAGLRTGLIAGLVGFALYGLLDAVTLGAKPGFLLWLVLGVAWAEGDALSGQVFPRRWLLPGAVLFAVTAVFFLPQNLAMLLLAHAYRRESAELGRLSALVVQHSPSWPVVGSDRDLILARAIAPGDPAAAGVFYQRYLSRSPADAAIHYERGLAAIRAGQTALAVQALLAAQESPGFALEARYQLLRLRAQGRLLAPEASSPQPLAVIAEMTGRPRLRREIPALTRALVDIGALSPEEGRRVLAFLLFHQHRAEAGRLLDLLAFRLTQAEYQAYQEMLRQPEGTSWILPAPAWTLPAETTIALPDGRRAVLGVNLLPAPRIMRPPFLYSGWHWVPFVGHGTWNAGHFSGGFECPADRPPCVFRLLGFWLDEQGSAEAGRGGLVGPTVWLEPDQVYAFLLQYRTAPRDPGRPGFFVAADPGFGGAGYHFLPPTQGRWQQVALIGRLTRSTRPQAVQPIISNWRQGEVWFANIALRPVVFGPDDRLPVPLLIIHGEVPPP